MCVCVHVYVCTLFTERYGLGTRVSLSTERHGVSSQGAPALSWSFCLPCLESHIQLPQRLMDLRMVTMAFAARLRDIKGDLQFEVN